MPQTHAATRTADKCFELRFQSLFDAGRALAFPCNASGDVDLDALSERASQNYLLACASIGREYATPRVLQIEIA
jgi:hypothetical protein